MQRSTAKYINQLIDCDFVARIFKKWFDFNLFYVDLSLF